MEREEDYRWTATSCLTVDARYLAFTGQTQFRKRRTAVGLRDVCQQCGRDLVRAICDCVGPVRADISTGRPLSRHRRPRMGQTPRPIGIHYLINAATADSTDVPAPGARGFACETSLVSRRLIGFAQHAHR
jgi:hypothetical protein